MKYESRHRGLYALKRDKNNKLIMLYTLIQASVAVALIYFIWQMIGRIYYHYFYYTQQGIPSCGVPLPILGDLLKIKKANERIN
jgi:hypothetical protein